MKMKYRHHQPCRFCRCYRRLVVRRHGVGRGYHEIGRPLSPESMKSRTPMKGDPMKGDAMKGDAMKGNAMKGDAMKGDAMKGDAMKPGTMGDDTMGGTRNKSARPRVRSAPRAGADSRTLDGRREPETGDERNSSSNPRMPFGARAGCSLIDIPA